MAKKVFKNGFPFDWDIAIEQGTSVDYRWRWKNVDLTGWTAKSQCRESTDATETIWDLNTENDGITLEILDDDDAESGKSTNIFLHIDPDVTADMDFRRASYDLNLISPDDQVKQFVQGKVKLHPSVTQ